MAPGISIQNQNGLGSILIAGAIAFLIATLTISYQAIKVDLANPINSLRTE
jgi:hypothetical protein